MEQFIRYLYEYRNGQPSRNVGFVKVGQEEGQTTVHIHGKGLQLGKETELLLYIFYMEEAVPVGILQGTIQNINPAVNTRLIFTAEDTGQSENYERIQGIIMESRSKRKFAAVWNDMPVDVEGMRLWEEAEPAPPTMTERLQEAAVSESARESAGAETDRAAGQFHEEEEQEEERQEKREETEERTEQCGEEDEAEEEIDAYILPSNIQYRKIRRQDIAMLPRCEWRLANNSFLLHGYYNYHHLVLMEEGDEMWLGVPGVYHRREARAAEAFGFGRFVRLDEGDVELAEDEREGSGEFGYWCRRVRWMR